MLLFSLAALRLLWRLLNIQPAAKGNVIALYLLMFLMPMTGFLTSTLGGHDISFYGIFSVSPLAHNQLASAFFSDAHEILSYLLMIGFAFHMIGALYHHYFLKDEIFKRMRMNFKNQ